jgi:tetratricopeptide (TPR) repeat protein
MITSWLLAGIAYAATPELVVVGLHTPGVTGDAALADANRIAAALDNSGKVDALTPAEVGARLAGREALILDAFALGPAREMLREGRILYDRAQPDQAIPVLDQAANLLAEGLATSTDARDLHEALTLLGLAHAGLGDEAAAKAAFRRAVVLDPARQLDAVNFPPQIVALYEGVRAQAAGENKGRLGVTAPAGTPVWVDGRAVGSTPLADQDLLAGEHYVLARAEDGAAAFAVVEVAAGERKSLAAELSPRSVGRPAADAAGRSKQTRELYRSVGQFTDRDPVLLAGMIGNNQVALQLYAPASGNFSRVLTGEAGDDPVSALLDLAPAAIAFLSDTGDIRSDRVSPQVVAFDISANDVLAGMLLEPRRAGTAAVTAHKGVKWYVWAGLGAVVAGGGATAAALALGSGGDTDTGTITFGPIP